MASSDQEIFWQGEFGDAYIDRNIGHKMFYYFSKVLFRNGICVKSAIELGANVGINLDTLKILYPGIETFGVEINAKAFAELDKKHNACLGSVYQFSSENTFELSFTNGVLIHQDPNMLPSFYEKLFRLSSRYILFNEYHSPSPVELDYRGNKGKLFKRDFGEHFWSFYPELKLVDYGFIWGHDPLSVGEDSNWFLFEKINF